MRRKLEKLSGNANEEDEEDAEDAEEDAVGLAVSAEESAPTYFRSEGPYMHCCGDQIQYQTDIGRKYKVCNNDCKDATADV